MMFNTRKVISSQKYQWVSTGFVSSASEYRHKGFFPKLTPLDLEKIQREADFQKKDIPIYLPSVLSTDCDGVHYVLNRA